MTITSTTNRVSYAGDDSTTAFSFPHKFLEDADLTVILVDDSTGVETEQTITTEYTVSGAGDASGGTVTMVTAPETGETLVILDDPALTQGTDLADGSALPAETVEDVFDRLTLIAQRSRDLVTRAFRLSDGDTSGASLVIPSPTSLNLIRWNSDADELENVTLTDLSDSVASVADNEVLAKKPGENADGLAISEQRVFGRITGGDVDELTPAEIIGIIDDVPVTLASAPVVSISGTDTYTADLGGDIADGERFVGKIANDNTGTTPTFENTGGDPSGAKTITDRAANALWAGALSGEHTFEYDGTADTFLVLDPIPDIPVSTDLLDEDDMASDSAAAVPTQQSVKAYTDAGDPTLEGVVDATNGGDDDLTEIDFTGIKSGAKRIIIEFGSVGLSGANSLLVQIGDSGGFETSAYFSVSAIIQGGTTSSETNTTGFTVRSSGNKVHGLMILTLHNPATNTWVQQHCFGVDASTDFIATGGGSKALSGELDRVRITVTGANTFNNGSVNVMVE